MLGRNPLLTGLALFRRPRGDSGPSWRLVAAGAGLALASLALLVATPARAAEVPRPPVARSARPPIGPVVVGQADTQRSAAGDTLSGGGGRGDDETDDTDAPPPGDPGVEPVRAPRPFPYRTIYLPLTGLLGGIGWGGTVTTHTESGGAGVAVAGAGVVTGFTLLATDLDNAQAATLLTGVLWGTIQGVTLESSFGIDQRNGLSILAQATGTGLGIGLTQQRSIRLGDVGEANVLALSGAWLGHATALVALRSWTPESLRAMRVGSVGALVGLAASPLITPHWELQGRDLLIATGGAVTTMVVVRNAFPAREPWLEANAPMLAGGIAIAGGLVVSELLPWGDGTGDDDQAVWVGPGPGTVGLAVHGGL